MSTSQQRRFAAQSARISAAYAKYVEATQKMAAIGPCLSHWPGDLPGPDYPGTSCDLVDGHAGEHRCAITGTTTVVNW